MVRVFEWYGATGAFRQIGNLQLATIPPRVHSFNAVARLSNDLAGLSNDLARLANYLAGLSNHLARPANGSINGVFDEKSQKLPFLAAGHAKYIAEIGEYSTSPMARFVLLK